jgi:hypothetical protein
MQKTFGYSSQLPFGNTVAAVALLGLMFQVGHFAEHAFQFIVWLLGDLSNICGRDKPWMSAPALWLSESLGSLVAPTAAGPRRMMLGMEVLHLMGNSIFLIGLVALYYVVPHRLVKWACFIETFHLYEHLMLTVSAVFIGKPVGMSTLFGAAFAFDKEAMVGIRVTWHFLMNLLPMPLAMMAIAERRRHAQSASMGSLGISAEGELYEASQAVLRT